MKSIYALLVGINDYPSPISKLEGCVHDIQEMKSYLESRIRTDSPNGDESLSVETLLDAEATRDAVIRAFRDHLGQARTDDVALFYFSGHGSQEQAPEEFWHLEPDHLDETLVCYDSRTTEGWDLADKELAKLISEVADSGAHVVVVLDCCHSGSGTRDPAAAETATRRTPTDLRKRPLESFLFSPEEIQNIAGRRDLDGRRSGWSFQGQHILLAACQDHEEAREIYGGEAIRGAFSYFLGETLRNIEGDITYRDLFERAAALVRSQVRWQTPQLEATVAADLSRPFLGGAVRPVPRSFVASYERGRWFIDAGRVQGIPPATRDAPAEVALFEFSASEEALQDPTLALGRAEITAVFGSNSQIQITEGDIIPESAPFKAVLASLPTPRLKVRLDGDPAGVELASSSLADSLFVREAGEDELADYRLLAQNRQYLIARPDDDRPLVGQVDDYSEQSAKRVVARLEHIERWRTTSQLDNPQSSIRADELQVEILQDGQPLTDADIRLEYTQESREWISPEFTIRLKNTGNRTLYVGLLGLPQTFGISSLLWSVGCQQLEPDEETFANGGEPMAAEIPDHLWQQGVNEMRDLIKVIVSTTSFDARRLEQPDLDQPRNRSATLRSFGPLKSDDQLGTLEQLMERVQTRPLVPARSRSIDDWRTYQFSLTTVRPLPAQPLQPGHGITLTDGVTIEPHPALEVSEVRVDTAPLAMRSLLAAGSALPRWLYDDPSIVQPLEFQPTRSVGGGLNVLELRGINDPRLITADSPLAISIPRALAPGEHVLPIASDGEFYFPLGWGESDGQRTRVLLQRLPQPKSEGAKSLGGALRIFFHKVVGRMLGSPDQYPILAVAEVDEHFNVHYQSDLAQVRSRVEQADRIALFIHGIIGETRSMVPSLRRAQAADRYDLVLTFDYENLNEPIESTAAALKGRLEEVGLKSGTGKQLDVIAHSMGGLVSRWFIEHAGGNQLVRRLVMLGTPNGGSPWPGVVDWATTALTVGLNELSKVAWPAFVLSGLVQATHWARVTLEQMEPTSAFLKSLQAGPGPKIPYTLIAGNTSRIRAGASEENRRSQLRRLLARLWSDRTKYELADLFFGGSNNDIAVSLESMQQAPASHDPAWHVHEVACDHLNYFQNEASLQILAHTLRS